MTPLQSVLAALAAALACAGVHAAQAGDARRGERIFTGAEALVQQGPIVLPAPMAACTQCHARSGATTLEVKRAPPLTAGWLLQARPRRGGPPSAFDRQSFCAALRSGIDPQYIVMRKSMPRFQLSTAQCTALWTFLSTGGSHD